MLLRLVDLLNGVVTEVARGKKWSSSEIVAALGWVASDVAKLNSVPDQEITKDLQRIREAVEAKGLPN